MDESDPLQNADVSAAFDAVAIEALVLEARSAIYGDYEDDLFGRMSDALAAVTDPAVRARLLLNRAIAFQKAEDNRQPAVDATAAAHQYRAAGDLDNAAFAASASASFWYQASNYRRCVEMAVEALVVLKQDKLSLRGTLPAANALANLFAQMYAFPLAIETSRQAVDSVLDKDVDPVVTNAVFKTYCDVLTAARFEGVEADLTLGREVADRLAQPESGDLSPVIGRLGQIEMLLADPPPETNWDAIDVDKGDWSDNPTRVRGWCWLILGQLRRQQGRLEEAARALDHAVPLLESTDEHHYMIRSLHERAGIRAELGDAMGAYEDSSQLAERVRSRHVEQMGMLATQVTQLAELEVTRGNLRERADRLAREVAVDSLTGVGSRRWIDLRIDELASRNGDVSVVIVDLDHFKQVNDQYGHHVGDLVLTRVGAVLLREVRNGDIVGRLGGEEFAVVLPNSSREGAEHAVGRICSSIESEPWSDIADGLEVTASLGFASGAMANVRELQRAADAALYEAKEAGRNRFVFAT